MCFCLKFARSQLQLVFQGPSLRKDGSFRPSQPQDPPRFIFASASPPDTCISRRFSYQDSQRLPYPNRLQSWRPLRETKWYLEVSYFQHLRLQ